MPQANESRGVPRLALRVEEAAAAIGLSDDAYRKHVAPHVRVVRRGRLRLVSIRELERFLEENAEFTLEIERAA